MQKSKENSSSVNSQDRSRKYVEAMVIDDDNSRKKVLKTGLCCSQRLIIAFLLGLSSFTFYAQRQSINMGIFCMVNHTALRNLSEVHKNHTAACKIPLSSSIKDEDEDDFSDGPYLWEKNTQGIILGSFFWGYLFQLFGGALAAKAGPKNLLAVAVFVSSASTIFIPLVAKWHYSLIIALRVFTGIAQGFMYPSCLPMITKWAPSEERGTLTSFLAAGSSLGTILATAISGPICKVGLWYINFVLLGSIGFIWLILWFIYGANSPDESRHISIHELSYIQATAEKSCDEKVKSIRKWPIKSILTSRSVWIIIITNVLSDFTLYGIFSVFPLFLWEIYNMDVVTNSYISAAEYALMWVTCVCAGILSDLFIRKKILTSLNTRKLFNSIGMIIPSLLFPLIGFATCEAYKIVILLLVLGGGLQGTFINAGYLSNAVDVSGSYSGIIVGLSNSIGSFSGILAPLVANILTHERTMIQWRTCFLVFSVVLFIGGLVFILFSKGDLEDWAKDDKSKTCELEVASDLKSRKNHTQKLTRQYSLDSRGGLVPSSSVDEYDSYNNVVYIKNPKNKTPHVQNF